MRSGSVHAEKSRLDDRTLGDRALPLSSFRFEPEQGEKHAPKLSGAAWHCEQCDALVLQGAHGSLECFECGAVIPGDASACNECGWSWK